MKGPNEEKLTYKIDEFYFLTDPHEHIYQHFPNDPKWQLLAQPISGEEFVRLPLLKSPFFNLRLAFAKDYRSVVDVTGGFQELQIVCPQLYNFTAKLISRDHSVARETLQEKILVRMVENDAVFLLNLPKTGSYYLDVYVAASHASSSMDHCCGFKIDCHSVAKHGRNIVYPQQGALGRLPYFEYLGLREETHVDSYITAHGEFIVAVTSDTGGTGEVRVTHALQYFSQRDRALTDCERYAFPKHRGDSLTSFIVKCPKRGLYLLSLYAESAMTSQRHDRSQRHLVYRYVIECREPVADPISFPKASKRWQHCKLITPLSGDLPLCSKVTFRIESSVARGVVVVIDDEWSYLVQRDGSDVWEGVVRTGPDPCKALVYARLDTRRDKYIPCLEYSIVNPE